MKSFTAIVLFAALAHCATAIVMETPEVAAARAAHLEAVRKATIGEFELPKADLIPVMESPEVAAARLEHLEAIRRAKAGIFELPKADLVPVMETPEVAAARIDHLNRHSYEALRNRLIASRYYGYPYAYQPIAYNAAPLPHYHTGFIPYYGF